MDSRPIGVTWIRRIFQGRLDRFSYLLSSILLCGLLLMSVSVIVVVLGVAADYGGLWNPYVDMATVSIPFIFFYLLRTSIDARRFHDIGYSGIYSLTRFIPLLGMLTFTFLLIVKGQEEENRLGAQRHSFSAYYTLLGTDVLSKRLNYQIFLITISVTILCFIVSETRFPLRESTLTHDPRRLEIDAKEDEMLGGWLAQAIVGYIP